MGDWSERWAYTVYLSDAPVDGQRDRIVLYGENSHCKASRSMKSTDANPGDIRHIHRREKDKAVRDLAGTGILCRKRMRD